MSKKQPNYLVANSKSTVSVNGPTTKERLDSTIKKALHNYLKGFSLLKNDPRFIHNLHWD